MAAMTYKALLEALSTFTPEQLAMPVRYWGEGKGGKIGGLTVLEDDYGNPSGDGAEPRAAWEATCRAEYGDNWRDDADDFNLVAVKGTPILQIDEA